MFLWTLITFFKLLFIYIIVRFALKHTNWIYCTVHKLKGTISKLITYYYHKALRKLAAKTSNVFKPYNWSWTYKGFFFFLSYCGTNYLVHRDANYVIHMVEVFFTGVVSLLSGMFNSVFFSFQTSINWMRSSGVDFHYGPTHRVLVGPRLPESDYWVKVSNALTESKACWRTVEELKGADTLHQEAVSTFRCIRDPRRNLGDFSPLRLEKALHELKECQDTSMQLDPSERLGFSDHTASIQLLEDLLNLQWSPADLPDIVYVIASITFIILSPSLACATYLYVCLFWTDIPHIVRYHVLAECIRRRELPEDLRTLWPGLRLLFLIWVLQSISLFAFIIFIILGAPAWHTVAEPLNSYFYIRYCVIGGVWFFMTHLPISTLQALSCSVLFDWCIHSSSQSHTHTKQSEQNHHRVKSNQSFIITIIGILLKIFKSIICIIVLLICCIWMATSSYLGWSVSIHGYFITQWGFDWDIFLINYGITFFYIVLSLLVYVARSIEELYKRTSKTDKKFSRLSASVYDWHDWVYFKQHYPAFRRLAYYDPISREYTKIDPAVMVSPKTYTLLRLITFCFTFVLTSLCHIGFNNFTEAYLLSKGEFIATPPALLIISFLTIFSLLLIILEHFLLLYYTQKTTPKTNYRFVLFKNLTTFLIKRLLLVFLAGWFEYFLILDCLGTDSRIFTFTFQIGVWYTTGVSSYLIFRAPLWVRNMSPFGLGILIFFFGTLLIESSIVQILLFGELVGPFEEYVNDSNISEFPKYYQSKR